MNYIQPKNWDGFQHYKDRSPQWIKLHKSILDNIDFHRLPVASKALAPCIWLLASEYKDGKIPLDYDMLAFRLRMPLKDVQSSITPLIDSSFFVCYQDDSTSLAECLPREEKRREYKEEKSRGAIPAESPQPKSKKGTRLPADWKPSDDLLSWAKQKRPDLNLSETLDRFRDFWTAKPGAGGCKLDWDATYRNWVRSETTKPFSKPEPIRPEPTKPKPETPEQAAKRRSDEQAAWREQMKNMGVAV